MPLSINELIPRVDDVLQQLRLSIRQVCRSVPELPPILYHYTGAEAFMKIVKEGAIWATNTSYLNDTRELTHAHSIATQVFHEKLKETDSVMVKVFLVGLLENMSTYFTTHDNYVASFCEVPDLLSQWRGYGRGIGYAMGFEPEKQLASMPIAENCRILSVIYDPKQQKEIIEAWIDSHISSLTGMGSYDSWFDEATLQEISSIPPSAHIAMHYDGDNPCTAQAQRLISRNSSSLMYKLFVEFLNMKHSGFSEGSCSQSGIESCR